MSSNSVILFDGDCNLCNHFVQFVISKDKKKNINFSSLQSQFGRQIVSKHKLQHIDSIIYLNGDNAYTYSDAIIEILKTIEGIWSIIGYFIKIIPKNIRNYFYKIIAKKRFSLFGKTNSCLLPSPELNARFL